MLNVGFSEYMHIGSMCFVLLKGGHINEWLLGAGHFARTRVGTKHTCQIIINTVKEGMWHLNWNLKIRVGVN